MQFWSRSNRFSAGKPRILAYGSFSTGGRSSRPERVQSDSLAQFPVLPTTPGRLAALYYQLLESFPSDDAVFDEVNTASATLATCSNASLSDLSLAIARMP